MATNKTEKSAYDRLIDHFDGVPGLADALGITTNAVYLWGGCVPKGRAFEIESITNGKFKASDFIDECRKRA